MSTPRVVITETVHDVTVEENELVVRVEEHTHIVEIHEQNAVIAGGADLSDDDPTDVGTAADPGDSDEAARANHTHALSFDTVVDVFNEADQALPLNGQKITDLADPDDDQDAATKAYVDAHAGGGGGTDDIGSADAPGLAPAMAGAASHVLVDDGNTEPTWRQLTMDDIAPAFNASLSGGGTLEVGNSVVNPAFTASYTGGPATAATITDNDGNPPLTLSSPFTAGTMPHTYSKTANNASVTFTLSASKGAINDTAQASYAWRPRVYYGVSSNGSGNSEAFIEALASSALASSRATSLSVNAGSGEYIYYAYPASYGAATFTVGGFEGGFDLISATISVTNAHGVTQDYRLYRSTNPSLGSTNVVVT